MAMAVAVILAIVGLSRWRLAIVGLACLCVSGGEECRCARAVRTAVAD